MVRYPAEIYVPNIRLCTNCFRLGHSKLICRSKARCMHCGNINHSSNDCQREKIDSPTCINCSGNHLPTDKDCNAKCIEQDILAMAIRKHKTVQEVRSELKDQSNKRFRFSDFPELLSSFSAEEIQKALPEKNSKSSTKSAQVITKDPHHILRLKSPLALSDLCFRSK